MMISRIFSLIRDESFKKIFNLEKNNTDLISIEEHISNFLSDKNDKFLNIDLSNIPEEKNIAIILVNAIGRILLGKAKNGDLKESPIIVFLDEAHIFLNKKIKDEYSLEIELNAFERIAKECRKFGLFLCLSTQRPRDIPQGVLSQMGTFIAHRLINQYDREAIENASPEGSKYVLSFLPSLGEGEAVLMGVDFLTPINLKISNVINKPNSHTPELFKKPPTNNNPKL